MPLSIIIVDDHGIMRAGLESLIKDLPGAEVIGVAQNGEEAIELSVKLNPNLVIMDVSLPDMLGTAATVQILAKCPKVKVLALSMHSSRQYVIDMLQAGAMGYVLKESAFEELTKAINSIGRGQTYISPAVGGALLDHVREEAKKPFKEVSSLTSREREVLGLLGDGLSCKEAGDRLFVSHKTVHAHRRNIMEKLNAKNSAELTKWAIKLGLTQADDLGQSTNGSEKQ